MKINGTYVLRKVAGDNIIIPVGETALKYNGMLTVTETGADIWEAMVKESSIEEITQMILEKYEVEKETAEKDVREFLEGLEKAGFISL